MNTKTYNLFYRIGASSPSLRANHLFDIRLNVSLNAESIEQAVRDGRAQILKSFNVSDDDLTLLHVD